VEIYIAEGVFANQFIVQLLIEQIIFFEPMRIKG